jgi:hypothetical protein
MARPTAPSLWLPGFDPAAPALPHPAEQVSFPCLASPPSLSRPSTSRTSRRRARAVCGHRPRQLAGGGHRDRGRPAHPLAAADRADLEHLTGPTAKFEANLAAIALLRQIEAEGRPASADERQVLQRYTGWGGLPASFNLEAADSAWAERARRLQELLPAEDYESARASVNNSHYTEVHVIEAIWQAVERFGFTGGRILEPAAGIGHFIGAMPRNLAERSSVTAVEIDRVSGRILKALYAPGGVDVRISPFEKTPCPTTGSTW